VGDPSPIWTPSPATVEQAEMTAWLHDLGLPDYNALWAWSVADVGRFWKRVWDRYEVQADGDPAVALADATMPGARWFPDVALSYPEHVFKGKSDDAVAVYFTAEGRELDFWTWARLRIETARIRAGLRAMGVERGDRVAACLPNIPETLAAFLATTSLGAIWSCCSPDFGSRTMVDRFAQIEPKVLLAVDGYRYGGKRFDRSELIAELRRALPTVQRTVVLPHLGEQGDWDAVFESTDEPIEFLRVPFEHPLWIVYSSGTTGLPKAIVHGHGGMLLGHLVNFRLHHDVRPGDRLMWFTTTGWIMWNYLVSGLLSDVSIVLFDGNPGYPDLGTLWDVAADARATLFGCGAAFIHGCIKAGIDPIGDREGLGQLRSIGSTGSPLAPEAFDWIYQRFGTEIWLASVSGGTDIAGAFVGGAPIVPVYRGELQARMLGVDLQAWDDDGSPLTDEVGELVVTQPMPSMPVRFWNDPGDRRYIDAYFSTYPGVWRHGDWIRITPRGSAVIYGRSDSTINRGGIRIGTAEVYAAVLSLEQVAEALAVDVPSEDGTGDGHLFLFVALAPGAELDDELRAELRARIRSDCSPRHVPDDVIATPEVPRTLTGKLLEVPVKRLLMGRDVKQAASRDALVNPAALDWFVQFARERRRGAQSESIATED
jgi:acetoacetyl-CoA synthetase